MLTKWWKNIGYLYIFCLKDVFSYNNNYMDYPGNNGDDGRGNYCLC